MPDHTELEIREVRLLDHTDRGGWIVLQDANGEFQREESDGVVVKTPSFGEYAFHVEGADGLKDFRRSRAGATPIQRQEDSVWKWRNPDAPLSEITLGGEPPFIRVHDTDTTAEQNPMLNQVENVIRVRILTGAVEYMTDAEFYDYIQASETGSPPANEGPNNNPGV